MATPVNAKGLYFFPGVLINTLFTFTTRGGGGRGMQFSIPLLDHVHVSKADTAMYYV